VFPAESAILIHFQPVRIVLFVLHGVIVSLLALGASQGNLNSQLSAPPYNISATLLKKPTPGNRVCLPPSLCKKNKPIRGGFIIAQQKEVVNYFFTKPLA